MGRQRKELLKGNGWEGREGNWRSVREGKTEKGWDGKESKEGEDRRE